MLMELNKHCLFATFNQKAVLNFLTVPKSIFSLTYFFHCITFKLYNEV